MIQVEVAPKGETKIRPLRRKTPSRVLIVDDDPVTVRTLKKLLAKIDPQIEVAVAFHGGAVAQQLEIFLPDLILLDLLLPGIDGFQVCRTIRADALKRHIKILAITALPGQDLGDKILAVGADRFVRKPFDLSALGNSIVDLLEAEDQPSA